MRNNRNKAADVETRSNGKYSSTKQEHCLRDAMGYIHSTGQLDVVGHISSGTGNMFVSKNNERMTSIWQTRSLRFAGSCTPKSSFVDGRIDLPLYRANWIDILLPVR